MSARVVILATVESIRPELRAGWMDAVRVFRGRPRMSVRCACRIGTAPYAVGFLAGAVRRCVR